MSAPAAAPTAREAARLVLGTAGHIDHGKTALALALTGRDTDRLPAEKARGISIELGFAPLELPSGRAVSLVDVPGHERFVRHMVAGSSGVDGYLLCVAADDGVMPQTVEHMAVLRLLGVRDGVVALTKADLADEETLGLVEAEARELVGPEVEVVPVCAPRGEGLPQLIEALERLAARLPRRTAGARARLFVDRAFSVVGAGTVVTGTIWGGPLAVGERVIALPGGAGARVRSIEVHDHAVAAAAAGRVALNLAGIEREDVPRGACIVRAGDGWEGSDLLDVALEWLPDAPAPLRTRRRLQAFLGTAELPATCVLLEGEALAAGERAYAQLRLDRPVPAEAGDRLVLRSAERRTVGGAVVVDPRPRRHGRGARAALRLAVLERADPVEVTALRLREAGARGLDPAGEDAEVLRTAGAVLLEDGPALDAGVAAGARAALLAALAGDSLPVAAALAATGLAGRGAEALAAALQREGAIVREGARLRLPGAREADPATAALAAMLADAGITPPTAGELGRRTGLTEPALRRALAQLREAGAVVQGADLWFDAAAAASARARAAEALASGPMTIAELRDLWGVGRKHALALAAHLDASGLTRRVGDHRALRRGAAGGAGSGGGG
jgi:selenocysteine-specific elongation factor